MARIGGPGWSPEHSACVGPGRRGSWQRAALDGRWLAEAASRLNALRSELAAQIPPVRSGQIPHHVRRANDILNVVKGTTLTAEQRRLRARVGALALHAQGGTTTRAATSAFLERFEREVVAAAAARGETLTSEETHRRALLARKAYMSRLALRSSRMRGMKKTAPLVADRDAVVEVSDDSAGPRSAA